MRKTVLIFLTCCLFFVNPAQALEWYLYGLGGAGAYTLEDKTWSGAALGFKGGIQASDEISFEATGRYDEVDNDQYYFALVAARYRFPKLDFFLEPGLDIYTGALIPVGEKTDVDGVAGMGLEWMYHTRYSIDFGPRVDCTLVFAGSDVGIMYTWTAVLGYRFK